MQVAGKYLRNLVQLPLGEGGYGFVYKATDMEGKEVAIKEMKSKGSDNGITQSGMRELCALKELKHENIVTLLDVVCWENKLYLVLECLDDNIFQWLRWKGRAFTEPEAKVCTIWYRAPEILLGTKVHGFAMDVWSLGCVFAEMVAYRTLFCSQQPPHWVGDDERIQTELIFSILGFPNESTWPYRAMDKFIVETKIDKIEMLHDLLPKFSMDGIEFLMKLLQLNPSSRISSFQALNEKYMRLVVMLDD